MKIKTSELADSSLDWAVAKCEAIPVARHNTGAIYLIDTPWRDKSLVKWLAEYSPSKHWAQGGPIIDREDICIKQGKYIPTSAYIYKGDGYAAYLQGDTPLIAAMRCFVASTLGDEVDIPEELL